MDKPTTSRSDPESRKAYTRWHYAQNVDAYKDRAKVHNERTIAAVRAFLLEYLQSNPCIDCGEADPVVLEFDHRLGVAKRFNLGDAVRRKISLKSVIAEVEKCDVRCANCHRRKTYADRGLGHKG